MIGVFDSGLGGLTFLKEFNQDLPDHNFIYLGDNARAPYGPKSQETIYQYTRQGVEFLFSQGCELVILACNTASAEALRKIQQELLPAKYPDKKALGVLAPIAEGTVQTINYLPKKNKIGVIGSRSTIESEAYKKEIEKLNSELEIHSKATPLLVPLVEEGWIKRRETRMILKYYLRELKLKKINVLVPGCTHYPVLRPVIQEIMGTQIIVPDAPKLVSLKLTDYLKRHSEIEEKIKKEGQTTFYTTDNTQKFKTIGQRFYKNPIRQAKKINLE
jgi:glutamate racemase